MEAWGRPFDGGVGVDLGSQLIDISMVPSNVIGILVLGARQRVPSIAIDKSPTRCTPYPPNVNDPSTLGVPALRDDQHCSF